MTFVRQLGLYLLCGTLVAGLLLAWIGLVYAINVYTTVEVSADAILNMMLTGLLSVVGLPIVHRALYRRFWDVSRKTAAGELRPGAAVPVIGVASPPVPRVRTTWQQRALYTALYVVGIASLLAAYAPLRHHEALNAFLARFSAGRSSFSSLATLMVVYVPMAISLGLAMLLLSGDRKRLEAGTLPPDETLRLQLRQDWVFSFMAAYVLIGFLAFLAGHMLLAYL
ncbi:hypothetical protein [Luteimonas sp. TWI1416]|uniref:hypothetical protein n=1 Tax=unclassified Luteimonas TaxID=2629088 RepID=UPI00320B06F0